MKDQRALFFPSALLCQRLLVCEAAQEICFSLFLHPFIFFNWQTFPLHAGRSTERETKGRQEEIWGADEQEAHGLEWKTSCRGQEDSGRKLASCWRSANPAGGLAVRSQRNAIVEEQKKEREEEESGEVVAGGISGVCCLQRQHELWAAGNVRMSHSREQLI